MYIGSSIARFEAKCTPNPDLQEAAIAVPSNNQAHLIMHALRRKW